MATVIYVPQDTRYSNAGRAIGNAYSENRERQRQREAEEARREAYQQGLGIAQEAMTSENYNAGDTYRALGEALSTAGREDQLDELMSAVMEARTEERKRRTASSYTEHLPESHPLKSRVGNTKNIDADTLKTMAETEDKFRADTARSGERTIKIYNPQGGEREAFIPKTIDSGAVDEYVRKQHGPEWSAVKGKDQDGGGGVNAKDIRDVNAELVNRGIEAERATPQQRAGARNVVNNNREALRFLAQIYGKDVVEDPFGSITVRSFRGEDGRIKYSLASQAVDDFLFDGMSPQDAVAEAEKQADRRYTTGEWLPREVKNLGPDAVEQFLQEREINDPQLVEYVRAESVLEDARTNPSKYTTGQVREAHEKVLRTRNPNVSPAEIKKHLDDLYGAQ